MEPPHSFLQERFSAPPLPHLTEFQKLNDNELKEVTHQLQVLRDMNGGCRLRTNRKLERKNLFSANFTTLSNC